MNKRELLNSVTDPTFREVGARFLDLMEKCERSHEPQFTYFMSPEAADVCERLWIASKLAVKVHREGGHEEAEYVQLGICQSYEDLTQIEFPLTCIKAVPTSKTFDLSHRDVLGALMGMGVQRNRTGDLFVTPQAIFMIVHADIAGVVLSQLESIGRYKLNLSEIALSNMVLPEPEGEKLFKTVSSMRLDAVLSAGFNLSRGDAQDLIRSEKVKVDHRVVSDGSKTISETALISCRGKGRIRLLGTDGISKKDRIKLHLLKMG